MHIYIYIYIIYHEHTLISTLRDWDTLICTHFLDLPHALNRPGGTRWWWIFTDFTQAIAPPTSRTETLALTALSPNKLGCSLWEFLVYSQGRCCRGDFYHCSWESCATFSRSILSKVPRVWTGGMPKQRQRSPLGVVSFHSCTYTSLCKKK